MTGEQVKALFQGINIWKRGDERAPHKPLLLLYALGRLRRGMRWLTYADTKRDVGDLLLEFGPPRATKVIDPFLRLAKDGLWGFLGYGEDWLLEQFKESVLMEKNVSGGFSDAVHQTLRDNPQLVNEIAESLLHEHFPESLHEDILTAVGLDLTRLGKSTRDPAFRQRVLLAYEYSCAVCGFNVRLGNAPVALDAAHIQWHQSGGPDIERNGLALCSLHHKLFDRGAFTLVGADSQYIVKVAQQAHGTSGFTEWLMRFHDKSIRRPQSPEYYPRNTFAEWHLREVFREPARYSAGSS